jgi:D-glycero-D-manno-heptose 1,7-bisphosphate phosphatase
MNAIFLDRDGVIIRKASEGEYIADWREVEFLTGALEAVAEFCRAGYKVMLVTNQRGVATGKIRPSSLSHIHQMLSRVVADHGGELAAIYCCTHDLAEGCVCRKPNPGMLLQAAAEHGLDLTHCWMIGDSATDITAGKRAGCKTALISDSDECTCWRERPDVWAGSLDRAAGLILSLQDRSGPPSLTGIQ